jgi:hypothetical protein
MATPDHMKGIDALPRAKTQVYYRNGVAVPINNGPLPAARVPTVAPDWQTYQAAWKDWQARGGRASGPPPKEVRDMIRAQGEARDAELKAKGYGPARFDKLNEAINKQLQKAVNQAVADKAPKHSTLVSQVPSTCLASLKWKDGIATAEFYRGGQVVYDFPMSKDDFIDWVSSDSIGQYGNAEVFD